ncbi:MULTISPECIES: lactate utilization protein B [unclassified Carboxylicivirga]|uniref:lactate utilization protein B n=1 Tax=Carboxylicivirga TaxID=1628153 RepID=UPI003D3313C6
MNRKKRFKKEAQRVSADLRHRRIIQFNMSKYESAVEAGKERYSDLSRAKYCAAEVKNEVLGELPYLLETFERNAQKNGAEVYWAATGDQLIEHLVDVLHGEQAKMLVKSKSMVTEEIDLNAALEKEGIESVETDLGEFIVQVAGEKPYHIVTPAMHKSKQDIAELFNKHFDTDLDLSAEEMTGFVRKLLRKKFLNADVGITGANFLCAAEGAVAVTENEGNAFLSGANPNLHIVIAGIEKVLPSISDLALFWPLLAAHGTGQQQTVYSNLFFGPRKGNEKDGPKRMIIFLLDNGRSSVYADKVLREALKCIRCGACLNACPVYRNIGGYTYNTTYSGPIGSVLTPHFKDFGDFNHLSFASSLCGKCNTVCPVNIPLTHLLLHNRQQAQKTASLPESFINKLLYASLSNRQLMNMKGGVVKNSVARLVSSQVMKGEKRLPDFAPKTFNEQWKKHKKR